MGHIEIANSTPKRDTKVKRSLYARAGVAEYWVFDVNQQEFRVYRNIQNPAGKIDYQVDVVWSEDAIAIQALSDIQLDSQSLRSLMNT